MMTRLFADTRPEAEAALLKLARETPAWRKLALVGQMSQTVRTLALSGLRQRHPDAAPGEICRHLADLLLGAEMAAKIGPWEQKDASMLPEPVAVTLIVTQALEALGVPYLIGGSFASAVHGIARATLDTDIVADLRAEHAELFVRTLGDAFYVEVESILDAVARRDSFNIIHQATLFKVDIFIPKGRAFDRAQFERRERHTIATDPEWEVYVATAEDTVLAKLEWHQLGGGAMHQWEDLLGVLKTQGDRLDLGYLRRWADELGVTGLLDRALREAELTHK